MFSDFAIDKKILSGGKLILHPIKVSDINQFFPEIFLLVFLIS